MRAVCKVRSILSAAPWAPNHGKTEPWRFVVFGGPQKDLLLNATLKWHTDQSASFWESAYITPKGKPEFKGGAAFEKYYTEEVGESRSTSQQAQHIKP